MLPFPETNEDPGNSRRRGRDEGKEGRSKGGMEGRREGGKKEDKKIEDGGGKEEKEGGEERISAESTRNKQTAIVNSGFMCLGLLMLENGTEHSCI